LQNGDWRINKTVFIAKDFSVCLNLLLFGSGH